MFFLKFKLKKNRKEEWVLVFIKKNRVCFNLVLAHIDYALIDYVIVHELCHFLEANHSKAFYHEIEKRMPDYKERERLLRMWVYDYVMQNKTVKELLKLKQKKYRKILFSRNKSFSRGCN